MSNSIDQKAYLQKYLGGPSADKKKKKKKAIKGKGFKIIDDDIDLSKLRALEGDELDILDEGEDAPQIAGIIDERPEELKKLEQFKTSSKWKVVNQDDGFNSKLQIQEIKTDLKEIEKENEIIFGKMYSDSEDEKRNDSDVSPPRKQSGNSKTAKSSKTHGSDSDISPPRKGRSSPKRTKEIDSKQKDQSSNNRIRKPSRWGDVVSNETRAENTRDRSEDSHRKSKKDSPKGKHSSDSSPPRKSKNYDSDQSPPRKSRKNYDSDVSPPRKSKYNYDSDLSPPRKSNRHFPSRKSRKNDSDESPPRKTKRKQSQSPSPSKRRKHSPKKQNRHNNSETNHKSRKMKLSSDSDLSPPRKKHQPESPVRKSRNSENNKRVYNSDCPKKEKDKRRTDRDSPPPSNKKMAKTLDGKMAGLQDAKQLRNENEAFRRREDEVYNKMSDEVSGRNAKAVSRKVKRETSADREKQREKAERQKVLDEKYKKWSKGLKQLEAQEAQMQDFIHEASKPLARHKDDRDLEDNLKKIERDGDPMLQYMREKKRERGELGPEKPTYKGSFPPNRFNIRPGYRWDGVDRSNGYEKKYFEQQSKKKAQLEEAYKWSTEDL